MHRIDPIKNIKAVVEPAADKSISHRAAILSALSSGKTKIYSFLKSEDTLATLNCLSKLGVNFSFDSRNLSVEGRGLNLSKDKKISLFANESGTTMRILSGLLAGQRSIFSFGAGPYLLRRPMGRVIYPLREMGANIGGKEVKAQGKNPEIYPPLEVKPALGGLVGRKHRLKIASAQIKSALLLAGLYAKGKTQVEESYQSRDHTEKMLAAFGASIRIRGKNISLDPTNKLSSLKQIFIPADFSSAAFFIVLGLILKDTEIEIKKVNINPTRCGLLTTLKKMGANIQVKNYRDDVEPYADILVRSSRLKATTVEPEDIPIMIDEVPILCVAAAFAEGETEIKGVLELTVKETNRVESMLFNLKRAGVDIESRSYQKSNLKIIVKGKEGYPGANFKSYGDHRTAMSLAVFALAAKNSSRIDDLSCIKKSFPEFMEKIDNLRRDASRLF